MKFSVFKVSRNTGRGLKSVKLNIEKVLFLTLIGAFIILVTVQTLLAIPATQPIFNSGAQSEGRPLGVEEYLYNAGEIVLALEGNEGDESLKVLVNGDEVADFANQDVRIDVKDGDVVEIDGSRCIGSKEVKIISASKNITDSCVGKSVKAKSNIKRLVHIRVN